jgi:hypothetical protein
MPRFNPFQKDENALPPEQVRFLDVHVEPWPDGRRVRVHVSLTPFQQPPNLEMSIVDPSGSEISRIAIIENIDFKFVLTMHLRDTSPHEEYLLEAAVSYEELGIVARESCNFQVQTNPSS